LCVSLLWCTPCNNRVKFIVSQFFFSVYFFFNDMATTEIYTLSLHDALPISNAIRYSRVFPRSPSKAIPTCAGVLRSEEHTSELQSHLKIVCRLLFEKKK